MIHPLTVVLTLNPWTGFYYVTSPHGDQVRELSESKRWTFDKDGNCCFCCGWLPNVKRRLLEAGYSVRIA